MSNKITYKKILSEFVYSDNKKAKITKVILCGIAIASIPVLATFAIAVGNGIQVLKLFNNKYNKDKIQTTLANLKYRKLIEYISDKDGITTIRITKRGESMVKRFAIDFIKIKNPNIWDQKWHLVMFDLPVRYSKARNALRFKLKQMGLVQFQKSVWIYPYKCEDEISFVSYYYKVSKYIEFIEASSLSNDIKLRKKFNLA